MTIEELQSLAGEQYAEFKRLGDLTQAAGRKWCDTRNKIEDLEKQAEIERLVQERLNTVIR